MSIRFMKKEEIYFRSDKQTTFFWVELLAEIQSIFRKGNLRSHRFRVRRTIFEPRQALVFSEERGNGELLPSRECHGLVHG